MVVYAVHLAELHHHALPAVVEARHALPAVVEAHHAPHVTVDALHLAIPVERQLLAILGPASGVDHVEQLATAHNNAHNNALNNARNNAHNNALKYVLSMQSQLS